MGSATTFSRLDNVRGKSNYLRPAHPKLLLRTPASQILISLFYFLWVEILLKSNGTAIELRGVHIHHRTRKYNFSTHASITSNLWRFHSRNSWLHIMRGTKPNNFTGRYRLFFTRFWVSSNTRRFGRYGESCEWRQFYFTIVNKTSHYTLQHIIYKASAIFLSEPTVSA